MAMPELHYFFGLPLRFGCFVIAVLGLGIGGVGIAAIIMFALVEQILKEISVTVDGTVKKAVLVSIGMSSILLIISNAALLLGVLSASAMKVKLAKWVTFMFVLCILGAIMYPSLACYYSKENCQIVDSKKVEELVVMYGALGIIAAIWLYFMLTRSLVVEALPYINLVEPIMTAAYKTIYIIAFWTACFGFPIDDPIRIDLPVYNQPEDMPVLPSDNLPLGYDTAFAQSILPENHPGGDPVLGGNFISNKLQAATNYIGDSLESKAGYIGGPFADPVTKIESAVHETEGFGSKALSIKENIQNIVAGLFQPKPIVDTISEEEKYGNTGDKFYSAGQAVVGGASSVSNLVNSVLEVPGKIFSKITRAATEKLNNLGGKLIGL